LLDALLTSPLDGGEWSDSRPGRFTSGVRVPSTHRIIGWGEPRALLDAVTGCSATKKEKKKKKKKKKKKMEKLSPLWLEEVNPSIRLP